MEDRAEMPLKVGVKPYRKRRIAMRVASRARKLAAAHVGTLTALLGFALCAQVGAAGVDAAKDTDFVVNFATFGVTFYRGLAASVEVGMQPKPQFASSDPVQIQADVVALTSSYKAQLAEAEATSAFAKSAGSLLITSVEVGAISTGVGAVPVAIFDAGASRANEYVSQKLYEQGHQESVNFLKTGLQKWDAKAGVQPGDIKKLLDEGKVAEAADKFDRATGTLTKLRNDLGGKDSEASKLAEDYIFTTLKNTTLDDIKKTGENKNAIDKWARFTTKSFGEIKDQLASYQGQLERFNGQLQTASRDIEDLKKSQDATAGQVAVIENVLFEQQPPSVKLYMLQQNAKPGLTVEQRDTLIKYYTAEAAKQEIIRSTAQVVGTVNQVYAVMVNLKLGDPNLAKVVQGATVAQNVLSQALTGNYLGAIVSLTGFFGGGPDQETMHYQAIMGKLEEIQKQLKQVLELQVETLKAVAQVSQQIADLDRRLNERLDALDMKLTRVDVNLRASMWAPFRDCETAKQTAIELKRPGTKDVSVFDIQSKQFTTYGDLAAFLGDTENNGAAATHTFQCGYAMENLLGSIKSPKTMGHPLSVSGAASDPTYNGNKTDLDTFNKYLYAPAFSVFMGSWRSRSNTWGGLANALSLLSSPAGTIAQLQARIDTLNGVDHPLLNCSQPTSVSVRINTLLCRVGFDPQEIGTEYNPDAEQSAQLLAYDLLGNAIVRDQMEDLTLWVSLAARPYDLWSGQTNVWYKASEIAEGKGKPAGRPQGQRLIYQMLAVLDVAIAQQAMMHGDLTAQFVYDNLWEKATDKMPSHPRPWLSSETQKAQLLAAANDVERAAMQREFESADSARRLILNMAVWNWTCQQLKTTDCGQGNPPDVTKDPQYLFRPENSWLAKNVLHLALRKALPNKSGDPGFYAYQNSMKPFFDAKDPTKLDENCKKAGERKADTPPCDRELIAMGTANMRSLFALPDDVSFDVWDDHNLDAAKPVRRIFIHWGDLVLEMPSIDNFRNGSLVYPASLRYLMAERERLVERWVDYEVMRDPALKANLKQVSATLYEGLAERTLPPIRQPPGN